MQRALILGVAFGAALLVGCVRFDAPPPGSAAAVPDAPSTATVTSASAPMANADDWSKTMVAARPAPEKGKNTKLARVSRTKEGAKPFSEAELTAALASVKPGMPWDEATKRVVAKVGEPAYSLVPGEKNATPFMFEQQWWWVAAGRGANGGCATGSLKMSRGKVESVGVVGTYWPDGHAAHIAEEVAGGGDASAGFLHVCEGKVTEKRK